MLIKLNEIPDDLDDILCEDAICCGTFSQEFDKAMLVNKFFEHGSFRRSKRIITSKAKELGVDGIISVLTGLTIDDIKNIRIEELKVADIVEMNRIADKYGFKIIKKRLKLWI